MKLIQRDGVQGGVGGGRNQTNQAQPYQTTLGRSHQQGNGTHSRSMGAPIVRDGPTCEHCANSLPWLHWQSNHLQKVSQIRAGMKRARYAFKIVMRILSTSGYRGNERPSQELWDKVLNLAPTERREPVYHDPGPKN